MARLTASENRRCQAVLGVFALVAVVVLLPSVASAETMGDHLWNVRENHEGFFDNNDSWVRPWRSSTEDGWGEFQGGHSGYFQWTPMGTTGNPLDGSLSLNRGIDTQFDAWTYLYVPMATTVSLTGDGDCVPRWFLNYQFDSPLDSPHEFVVGDPTDISLSAGWNRLDITGYSQDAGFLFTTDALASQVSIMNTSPVPEPSTICALASLLATGGVVFLVRHRHAVSRLWILLPGSPSI